MKQTPTTLSAGTALTAIVTTLLLISACAREPAPAGVVAAASPEAAEAGVRVLELGGNAIDAAIAVQFALGVTEPAMSGLGGQTQMLVQRPGEPPFMINGTSFSPAATPIDATSAEITRHRATTVPATVKTLAFAWQNFGSGNVTWAGLLAPAIAYADSGFLVGEFRHKVWRRHQSDLSADSASSTLFLDGNGEVPAAGSLFRQPVLASTMRRLAEHGADEFYLGVIAQEIAADMRANGGWITEEDLASVPTPRVHAPLETTYREFTVATLSPPGGGWVVLQLLNLLELSDPAEMRNSEAHRLRALARALRIGHSSRQTNPVTNLVNYESETSTRTSKETARALGEEGIPNTSRVGTGSSGRGETTHFTVVDGDGMAVSVTASINAYFGARVASPTLGFLYNDYMNEFELGQPQHPFALRPRSMPYSSMSPTIVSRDGIPVLALGSPGSARIISAVAQVTHRWIDLEEGIRDAVNAPRIHVVPPDALYLESDDLEVGEDWIKASNFVRTEPAQDLMISGSNAYFGGVHAIAFENGQWVGVADPRRDGDVGYARR